jgi:ribosomal protein S21
MNKEHRFTEERESQLRPLMVEVSHPDRLEAAIKKFKRKVKESRIMVDYQAHLEFVRPAQKRRLKRLRAISRAKHEMREMQDMNR